MSSILPLTSNCSDFRRKVIDPPAGGKTMQSRTKQGDNDSEQDYVGTHSPGIIELDEQTTRLESGTTGMVRDQRHARKRNSSAPVF